VSRFERKILFAIGLSVFLALGGSIFLAQGALREVYRVGVNERFGAELVHGVEARRGQLMALRSGSEQVADAVGWAVEAEMMKRQNTSRLESVLQELVERYELVHGIASPTAKVRRSREYLASPIRPVRPCGPRIVTGTSRPGGRSF